MSEVRCQGCPGREHLPECDAFGRHDVPTSARPCATCGELDHLHLHHITPRSRGGSGRRANLIDLCPSCHGEAHDLYRQFGLCR